MSVRPLDNIFVNDSPGDRVLQSHLYVAENGKVFLTEKEAPANARGIVPTLRRLGIPLPPSPYGTLDLTTQSSEIALDGSEIAKTCLTKEGTAIRCAAVITFKVGDDQESRARAAVRFVERQNRSVGGWSDVIGRLFAGHIRSVVGSMTDKEFTANQQGISESVLSAAKPDMAELGLVAEGMQINYTPLRPPQTGANSPAL